MAGLTTHEAFPFCIVEVDPSEVGPATKYPIGVDYDTIFKWVWRTRVWQVDAIITATASAAGGSVLASCSSSTTKSEDHSQGSALNEAELLCFGKSNGVYADLGRITDSSDEDFIGLGEEYAVVGLTQYAATIVIAPIWRDDSLIGNIVSCEGLYYLPIELNPFEDRIIEGVAQVITETILDTRFRFLFAREEDALNFIAILEPGGTVTLTPQDSSVTIDGQSGTRTWYVVDYVTPTSTGGGSITFNTAIEIVMTPIEYWTYNNGVDGDVWDSATGVELQDPFSVNP